MSHLIYDQMAATRMVMVMAAENDKKLQVVAYNGELFYEVTNKVHTVAKTHFLSYAIEVYNELS